MRNPLDVWKATPYREWSQLSNAMERIFDDLSGSGRGANTKELAFAPSCEVSEDKAHYILRFDLPGLSKEQVKIEIHDNQLTVSGERKEEKKEDTKRYHMSEVTYGSFLRTFALPPNIDPERVEARFDQGVLSISVAKSENSRTRQVNVK